MRAIEMNVAEVEAGKAAESKAQNAKVKAFAQMMVKDHSEALTKLRAVQSTSKTSDTKPSAAHQQSIDSMSKMSGAEFDRDYINMMVKDHQEALTFLEQQSKTGNSNTGGNANNPGSGPNTTLAKISEEMIPTVRHHLEEAKSIQKELGGSSTSTSGTPSNSNRNSESTNSTNTNRATPNSPSPNGTPNNPNSTPGTR
jgi:putative membrane protein